MAPTPLHRFVSSSVIAALLPLAAAGNAAAAPTKDQCVDAYTRAQDLRRESKLLGARSAFLLCANESCPKLVRTDCVKSLEELTQAMPGIVFEAKNGAGQDLSAVTVTMDDQPFADHLDGSAIPVDPGAHTFVFQAPDLPPAELKLVIREGDKGRRESVTIGPPPTPATPPAPAQSEAAPAVGQTPPVAGRSGARRTSALVVGGVGAAGLVVGGVFGIVAMSKKSDAQKACPDKCADQSDADKWSSAKSAGTVSTIAFIVGGVGLATGLVLWFTAKPEAAETSGVALGVGPASVQLRGAW
jgi:hypothetical protein